jgi:hypothetical protein
MLSKDKTYLSILSLFGMLVFSTLFINFNNLHFYLHTVRKRDLASQTIKTQPRDSFRELECYQNIYRGLFNKSQIVEGHESINKFMVAIDIDSHVNDTKVSTRSNNTLSKRELDDLLKILYSHKAFLADAHLLSKIEFLDSSINKKSKLSGHAIYKTSTFKSVDAYLNNQINETVLLTFGVEYESIEKLKDLEYDLSSNLKTQCHFRRESAKIELLSRDKNILAGFYIYCHKLVVHLPVFYTRGDFLWVSNDNFKTNLPRVFGDKPRSMNK